MRPKGVSWAGPRHISCSLCMGWIRVEFEWYQKMELVQHNLKKDVYLRIVILKSLHQCFHWTYHNYLKCMRLCLMDRWWSQFDLCFVYQVCVLGQFRWPLLMSNNIFNQNYEISKHILEILIYIRSIFRFEPYYLRAYINILLIFVIYFEM